MASKRAIDVVEVGPRDGLQIESVFIPTEIKIGLINNIAAAGVKHIEATSFVSPRAVPQLADAAEVIAGIDRSTGVRIQTLVPNARGAERAVASGIDEVMLFVSASDSHNIRNMNRLTMETMAGFPDVVAIARAAGAGVHGAVATAFGCPFEGEVTFESLFRVVDHYVDLGVININLGDTTGMATPPIVSRTCEALKKRFPAIQITLHFHNTRGLGLANVMAGLESGITRYDASLGGMGGCPYAPGASGNICTEDLVHLLHEMNFSTGIDLDRLIAAAKGLETIMGRQLPGQVMKAGPRLTLHGSEAVGRAVG
ncbi:MAG: hydroxymethylglutaryl-CoA lyase [Rhodospirillales bacterium]|jgi:hydroxymethylglutaryl-CoA lyase